jgi:hypothetical protein
MVCLVPRHTLRFVQQSGDLFMSQNGELLIGAATVSITPDKIGQKTTFVM